MRKHFLIVLLFLGLGTIVQGQQNDWALMPYASNQLLFGDTDIDHPTKSFSPGVGFELQWGWTDKLRVYGDLSYGSANGGNTENFFEQQYLMGLTGIQWDVYGQFVPDSKLAITLDGIFGWSYFQVAGFDANTGQLVARVPAEGAWSSSPIVGAGAGISYPLNNQVDVYLGYRHFLMIENDWGDGVNDGDPSDHIGQISVGLRLALNGHEPMAKIPQDDYDALLTAKSQAERERDEAQDELETTRNRYDAQVEDMYNVLSLMNNNLDSLEEKITVLRKDPEGSSSDYVVQNRENDSQSTSSSDGQWRIVIGSFPTAQRAQDFAAQRVIDGGEYEVVFIEDLNTYRVVYNSYSSLATARNDLSRVKSVISSAWIIRF